MVARTFGAYFKERRIAARKTLRTFCDEHGFDPGNLSKLERGRLGPPESNDKLEEYALALGLKRGSAEWYEFFDKAAAERGRVPSDLLSDEDVLGRLPVLFRTLRAAKIDPKRLDALIERIRRT
jgi:transcriptional regulator with XRE-family HTH domain